MYDDPRPSPIWGFLNWLSAIRAIMIREALTRFSGGTFGYAWAVFIPVSWIMAIAFFFWWIGRDAPLGVNLIVFLASGMLPYLIFRQAITSMMRTVKSNRHLLTLGPLDREDIFTATAALEAINSALTATAIVFILALSVGVPAPENALTAVSGLALALGIGVSLGRLTAVLALVSDSAMRLTPILLRPFFWLSGIFFMSTELPREIANWLWFNPLFHAIELLRLGLFGGFDAQFATPVVPLVSIAVFYLASRGLEAHFDRVRLQGRVTA